MFLGLNNNIVGADITKTNSGIVVNNLIQTPSFLFSIGNAKIKLNQPMGVTTDPDGNIYVADSGNREIKVFSSEGKFMYSFGTKGPKNSLLKYPYGLAFIDQQRLLVADTAAKAVKVFDKKGKYLGDFFSKPKVKPGILYRDAKDNIYVVDLENNSIFVFDLQGKKRKVIKSLEFNYIQGVLKDPQGNLVIANSGQSKVMFLTENNQLIREIDGKSDKYPKFSTIRGMAIDKLNRLIVSDTMTNKLRFFHLNGQELFSISTVSSKEDKLYFPTTIHTTLDGKIFVVDRGNNRIGIWKTE